MFAHTETWAQTSTAALFIIARSWKGPGRLSAGEQTSRGGPSTPKCNAQYHRHKQPSSSMDGTHIRTCLLSICISEVSMRISLIADKIRPHLYVHTLIGQLAAHFQKQVLPSFLLSVGCSVFLSSICRNSSPHSYL